MRRNCKLITAALVSVLAQPVFANQTQLPSDNILTPGRQVLKDEPEIKPLTVDEKRPGDQVCKGQTTEAECPKE